MCRSTDFHGVYFTNQDRLRVKSFFVRLSNLHAKNQLPEFLTLVYLPRINESALDISGEKIRPNTPAFVTLHRIINDATTNDGGVVYGSRERVTATEGVTFEVYLREEKVLKGTFRKDEDEEWKLECKCVLEGKRNVGDELATAEVFVGVEGHVAMSETVDIVMKRKKNRRRCLEEIPEEREGCTGEYELDGCCCSCGEAENGSEDEDEDLEEINMDGVRWAVDVGIWVMCLGVGFLVSKASAKRLRRKRIF